MVRTRIAAFTLVAAGALGGCAGNHFSTVPAVPQNAPVYQQTPQGKLQVVRGHIRPEILRASLVGTLPLKQELHLAIGLPLRDRAGLTALLDAISNSRSGSYRHYLS